MKVLVAAAPLPQRSFFTHRIVDPIPAPIRQTESKMLGILRQKVGAGSSSAMVHPLLLQFMNFHYIKHLINLLLCDLLPNLCVGSDFGVEDPPRHVGNEGFRIFGERGNLTPTIT
ncbi:hypothetical protein DVH24_011081 [Malus domestica]|uniref:Uncharacterized protein n=1 Tax=Malus domestica TaxID=3750 RepID=A0A498JUL6_MALDO|nr:hypothetical protein DVH24_011081 [Malus domestica]